MLFKLAVAVAGVCSVMSIVAAQAQSQAGQRAGAFVVSKMTMTELLKAGYELKAVYGDRGGAPVFTLLKGQSLMMCSVVGYDKSMTCSELSEQ